MQKITTSKDFRTRALIKLILGLLGSLLTAGNLLALSFAGDMPTARLQNAEAVAEILAKEKQLLAAVDAADKMETQGDLRGALEGYLKVIKNFPNNSSTVVRDHMEALLTRMNGKAIPLTHVEFEKLRGPITEAAQMNVIAAMDVLGDNLRKRAPEESFKWATKAADTGDPMALNILGELSSSGIPGVLAPDWAKAAGYFQKAADKGFVPAKAALGEFYLDGKGVLKDEELGIKYLREAVEAKNRNAMNKLGDYFTKSAAKLPENDQEAKLERNKDYEEAFKLFIDAKNLGCLDALGNLGVLYMMGGAPGARGPDPKKGAALFAEGAKAGNPLCIGLYALCLENGQGVARNQILARHYYIKGATDGDRRSMMWCEEHKEDYPKVELDP